MKRKDTKPSSERIQELRHAIRRTFDVRKTHAIPARLPDAPASWTTAYEKMNVRDRMPWKALAEVLADARAFVDPVLGGLQRDWTPGVGWEPDEAVLNVDPSRLVHEAAQLAREKGLPDIANRLEEVEKQLKRLDRDRKPGGRTR